MTNATDTKKPASASRPPRGGKGKNPPAAPPTDEVPTVPAPVVDDAAPTQPVAAEPTAAAPQAEATSSARTSRTARIRSSLRSGSQRIREALSQRGNADVVDGKITRVEDFDEVLSPIITEHKRLADLVNSGRIDEISDGDVVTYDLMIKILSEVLDGVQEYIDKGDQASRDYTDARVNDLSNATVATFNNVNQAFVKLANRDKRDSRLGAGPWIAALVLGVIVGWITNNFTHDWVPTVAFGGATFFGSAAFFNAIAKPKGKAPEEEPTQPYTVIHQGADGQKILAAGNPDGHN